MLDLSHFCLTSLWRVNTPRKKEIDRDAKNAKKKGEQRGGRDRERNSSITLRVAGVVKLFKTHCRRGGVSKLRNYSCSWPTETLTHAIRGLFIGTTVTRGNQSSTTRRTFASQWMNSDEKERCVSETFASSCQLVSLYIKRWKFDFIRSIL